MLRFVTASVVGFMLTSSFAAAAESTVISGSVVRLAEKTEMERPVTVNVGGLVIVVIRDSGSRPPQDVSVVVPKQLEALGVVRGVQNDQGVALMGGGYTWYLYRPTKAGESTIQVSYQENGDDGKEVKREYKLSVN
jgi:hypothetical protein